MTIVVRFQQLVPRKTTTLMKGHQWKSGRSEQVPRCPISRVVDQFVQSFRRKCVFKQITSDAWCTDTAVTAPRLSSMEKNINTCTITKYRNESDMYIDPLLVM